MKEDLNEFFSLIGKAKKEKEDEFRSLVGEIDIDSIFSSVKISLEEEKKKKEKQLKEEKKKKEKQAKQVKALEAWLYAEPKEEKKSENNKVIIDDLNGKPSFEVIDIIKPQPIGASVVKEEFIQEVIGNKTEKENENDSIDQALKILETITSKEEVRENTTDPEIIKIRRELEYLKNLVNAQGGGGEVRLEFLDDIDRNTAKVNGKFLKYESSSGKWIGADASGGGGGSDYASVAGIATYAITAGIATYASTAGVSTYSTSAGIATYSNSAGISTYASTAGIATYAITAGIATYASTAGIATYASTAGVSTYSTSAGIATYSISSGISTYASNAGYATTSGISTTSQGLTGTPDITVGTIIATTASFSGNVSIAGTLTYEDVTSVDSIGLITARSGIEIGPLLGIAATISSSGSATFSGILTASSFSGDLSGNVFGNADTATYATSSGVSTYSTNSGIATYATIAGVSTYSTNSGIATYSTSSGISTYATIAGVSTYSTNSGIATYATSAGVSTNVSGGTADVTSLILPDGLVSSVSQTTTTISETSIDTFSAATYRSAKYQIQISRGSEYQITEIFIVHDDTSSYGTEYATVKTGSTLSSFSTDIDTGNVRLLVTPTDTASTTFKLIRTLVEV